MARKIIQLINVPETETVERHLIALADDGSVWFYADNHGWTLMDEMIPQDAIR
jgi:hypothetical protein